MKHKNSHGGSALTIIEFEVRYVDEFGDCQDVTYFETLTGAMLAAKDFQFAGAEAVALVINQSVSDTIAVLGNESALKLGGWI